MANYITYIIPYNVIEYHQTSVNAIFDIRNFIKKKVIKLSNIQKTYIVEEKFIDIFFN